MEEINLENKTLEDIRYIAKMMGLKNISKFKKDELIEKILESGKVAKQEPSDKKTISESVSDKNIAEPVNVKANIEIKGEIVEKPIEAIQHDAEESPVLKKSRRGRPGRALLTLESDEPQVEVEKEQAPQERKTEIAKVEENKEELSKPEDTKVAESKQEVPKPEEVKAAEPKQEVSKPEEVKAVEPKQEAVKPEEVKAVESKQEVKPFIKQPEQKNENGHWAGEHNYIKKPSKVGCF